MPVSEAMTRDVQIANPKQSIRQAAQTMATIDVGALPVGEDGRLVGMITIATLPCAPSPMAKAPTPKSAR